MPLPVQLRVGAVVQCRMDSQRLPAKALADVHGRPQLAYLLERLQQVKGMTGGVVVATSSRPVDDPLEAYCRQHGVAVFRRADADNVVARLLDAARSRGLDAFFRVNGDSPFVDAGLLEEAMRLMADAGVALVTNIHPRSFPYGVSVELIQTHALQSLVHEITDPGDLEHATRFLYQNLHRVPYRNIKHPGEDLSDVRLTIDTPSDLAFFSALTRDVAERWSMLSFTDAVAWRRRWETHP